MADQMYILWHAFETHVDDSYEDFETFIGFFSSEGKCREAIRSLLAKGYFTSRSDKFEYEPYTIDRIAWTSGFVRGIEEDK